MSITRPRIRRRGRPGCRRSATDHWAHTVRIAATPAQRVANVAMGSMNFVGAHDASLKQRAHAAPQHGAAGHVSCGHPSEVWPLRSCTISASTSGPGGYRRGQRPARPWRQASYAVAVALALVDVDGLPRDAVMATPLGHRDAVTLGRQHDLQRALAPSSSPHPVLLAAGLRRTVEPERRHGVTIPMPSTGRPKLRDLARPGSSRLATRRRLRSALAMTA
jgi:hypothetical protein